MDLANIGVVSHRRLLKATVPVQEDINDELCISDTQN